MKKFIAFLLSAILICSLSFQVASASDFETEKESTYIEFIHEEGISDELKTKIENHLLGKSTKETRGLWCTLLGHSLVTTTSTKITHKVNATAPRCLEEIYEVQTCERCDYTNSTIVSSNYINCCS
jgi:hypothetical protein